MKDSMYRKCMFKNRSAMLGRLEEHFLQRSNEPPITYSSVKLTQKIGVLSFCAFLFSWAVVVHNTIY